MKRTIKGIRCDLGFTQEQFAKLLGITTQSLRNKEGYKTPLTANELLIISDLAKIEPRDVKLTKYFFLQRKQPNWLETSTLLIGTSNTTY